MQFPPTDRPVFLVHASVAVMDGDRILMVQEAKAATRGRWNLPGGHVDHGEVPQEAAVREAREEVRLDVAVQGLIGVYASARAVRFVYRAEAPADPPAAGDEILAVRWVGLDELLAMPDAELVSPAGLRLIVADLRAGRLMPSDAVRPVR